MSLYVSVFKYKNQKCHGAFWEQSTVEYCIFLIKWNIWAGLSKVSVSNFYALFGGKV